MKVNLTPLDIPNRYGRIYTKDNFKDLTQITYVMLVRDYKHELQPDRIIGTIKHPYVESQDGVDYLVGEFNALTYLDGSMKAIGDLANDFLKSSTWYITQVGESIIRDNKVVYYKFSHWILCDDNK